MNETMKPVYEMTENEIIEEICAVQDCIFVKCRELQDKNFDMVKVDDLIKEYESDKPVYLMNRTELTLYLRGRYKLLSRVGTFLNRIEDVYDQRELGSIISSYKEESAISNQPEIVIKHTANKSSHSKKLTSFMDDYRKYRQLQDSLSYKKEIKLDASALSELRNTVLNSKPSV